MESIPESAEAGGAGGASSYKALKRLDEQWLKMRSRIPGNVHPHTPNSPEIRFILSTQIVLNLTLTSRF